MATERTVSVVVPTHNRAHLLPRLLSSLFAQDLDDFEVVIVDDGSSDGTADVLDQHADSRLRVLRREGVGVSQARNAGTEAARGRYVAWCDDDDIWAPEKLRLQLEALEQTPEARWCNGAVAYIDINLNLHRTGHSSPPGDIGRRMLQRNLISGGGSGVLAERELALAVGGFSPEHRIFADWHMWAKMAQLSPIAAVDLPLVGYVDHAGGMSHDRERLLREFSSLQDALSDLAEHAEDRDGIDRHFIGVWMLRQQVGAGRRLDSFVMPYQLLRRKMMPPVRVVPHSLASTFAPNALRRRWAGQWRRASLEHHMAYAESWLAEARRTLPPIGERAPAARAGRIRRP